MLLDAPVKKLDCHMFWIVYHDDGLLRLKDKETLQWIGDKMDMKQLDAFLDGMKASLLEEEEAAK